LIIIKENKLEIESDIKAIRENKKGKLIKFFESDAESLNIANEQFELYLCNLCVFLSSNPQSFFNEAYRILKPGGQAVFSVWGKKEGFRYFMAINETLAKLTGTKVNLANFNLHDNMDLLREMLQKAGFKNFRKDYTNVLYDVFSVKDYLERLKFPYMDKSIQNLSKENLEKFNEEIDTILKEFENSESFVSMNILVFSVFK